MSVFFIGVVSDSDQSLASLPCTSPLTKCERCRSAFERQPSEARFRKAKRKIFTEGEYPASKNGLSSQAIFLFNPQAWYIITR